jgi:hypothetical protein
MFYVIVILAAIFAMPVKADEALKFHYTARLTAPASVQAADDIDAHVMALFRLSGVLLSLDGLAAGTMHWVGTNDLVKGVGPYRANGTLTSNDGSVLWYLSTGSQKLDGGKATYTGPITVIGGKGRFEGAKGDRTVSGARISPVETGGDNFGELVINIKK